MARATWVLKRFLRRRLHLSASDVIGRRLIRIRVLEDEVGQKVWLILFVHTSAKSKQMMAASRRNASSRVVTDGSADALERRCRNDARLGRISAGVAEADRRSGRLSPGTVRGYRELSDAGSKTAHLDPKTRELIALAVGVTRQCDGCITTHVHAARKQGATAEEIAEALGVAIAVNAGAALVFSARAMDAVMAGAEELIAREGEQR